MVSVLAFYSDDPSSIPAEVYNFSVKLLLKRTKINKKRPGLAHFLKNIENETAKLLINDVLVLNCCKTKLYFMPF